MRQTRHLLKTFHRNRQLCHGNGMLFRGKKSTHQISHKFWSVPNFSGTFDAHSIWCSDVFLARKTNFPDHVGQTTFFHSRSPLEISIKFSVETLRIKSLSNFLNLHLQMQQKSLHDCSFIGLPFTAFLGVLRSLEEDILHSMFCLATSYVSNYFSRQATMTRHQDIKFYWMRLIRLEIRTEK